MKKKSLLAAVAVFALLQFLPVAPPRTNPPSDAARTFAAVMKPPAAVQQIIDRSCADCHSNDTRWPWYTAVAPFSWPARHHVQDGRKLLNFSEWLRPGETQFSDWNDFEKICVSVRDGSMPLPSYTWLHRDAALTPSDREAMCAWVDTAMTRGTAR